MRIWAIGDLHLGFSTGKWMDRFGQHWCGHAEKVEMHWRDRVDTGDLVLLPGDFSWAMKAEEVKRDFEWLAGLPGRKVLIKGNHDYWWPKTAVRMQELLPPDTFAMKRKALVIDGIPLVGARGADFLSDDGTEPQKAAEAAAALERERRELELSVEHLATLQGGEHPPIALFHHPPFPLGSSESFFTRLLEESGVETCIYGHLHTPVDWERTFQGEFRGITYRLVSCDFLDFRPLLIQELS